MSYVAPPTWFRYEARAQQARADARSTARYAFDFADAAVTREFAMSKDGTRVPVNIVAPQGHAAATAANPVLLYGYGGYGVSMTPCFSPLLTRSGSTTAASTPSPTCAAAASSASRGTSPAT